MKCGQLARGEVGESVRSINFTRESNHSQPGVCQSFTMTGYVDGASLSAIQDGQLVQLFQLDQLGELFFTAVANVHENLPATLHE
jgi:hypothetical protein